MRRGEQLLKRGVERLKTHGSKMEFCCMSVVFFHPTRILELATIPCVRPQRGKVI